MKASRYNIIFEYNGKKMAFNSRSCALAEVDEDFFKILNNPPVDGNSGNTNLIESMKSGSYIVEDDFDELENLKMISFNGFDENSDLSLSKENLEAGCTRVAHSKSFLNRIKKVKFKNLTSPEYANIIKSHFNMVNGNIRYIILFH